MLDMIKRLVREEEGQGLVEYALIIVAISLVILVASNGVRVGIEGAFNKIKDALSPTTP